MLKHIDLSYSKDLIMIPDVTEVPNLEKLILKGCTSLSKIHTSLGDLKKLILLNLDGCLCLESLPYKISLESLEFFSLHGCLRLKKFPEIVGNMSRLPVLLLNETAIEGLPLSIKHLTGLTLLNLRNCKSLLSLPDTICCLTSLTSLTLSGCSRLDRLPKNLGNLTGLNVLDVSKTAIRELPSSLEHLSNLTSLNLSDCKELLSIPNAICNITNIKTLILSGCSKLEDLPENIGNLIGLKELEITAVREPPSSIFLLKKLEVLRFHGCEGTLSMRSPNPVCLELPSLSCLRSLVELELRDCNLRAVPNDIDSLHLLEKLNLSKNNFVCLPESIIRLSKLKDIYIENCTSLRSLPQIPLSTGNIWANGCTSLETLPNQLKQESFFEPNVYLLNCFKLADNQRFSDKLLTLLSCYFQELCYVGFSRTNRYELVVPGKKFPKFFTHQIEGASVTLEVPPNFGAECLAIGMCAAFEYLPSGLDGLFGSGSHGRTRHMLRCSIAFYRNGGLDRSTASKECILFPLPEKIDQVKPSHLWLIYLRREYFLKFIHGWRQILEIKFDLQIDFKTDGTSYVHSNWLRKIEENGFDRQIGFKTEGTSYVHSNGLHKIEENEFDHQTEFKTESTGLKVNKCGVHFVFKQDLSQTNEMDFFSDGEGSFSDGAGPCGEGSSNGMTGTKRKRM